MKKAPSQMPPPSSWYSGWFHVTSMMKMKAANMPTGMRQSIVLRYRRERGADQQGQYRDLAEAAGFEAQRHRPEGRPSVRDEPGRSNRSWAGHRADEHPATLKKRERCGVRDRIDVELPAEPLVHYPAGHGVVDDGLHGREEPGRPPEERLYELGRIQRQRRDHQRHAPEQRGVEDVLAQPSEQLLRDRDREEGADCHDPEGRGRRQQERE